MRVLERRARGPSRRPRGRPSAPGRGAPVCPYAKTVPLTPFSAPSTTSCATRSNTWAVTSSSLPSRATLYRGGAPQVTGTQRWVELQRRVSAGGRRARLAARASSCLASACSTPLNKKLKCSRWLFTYLHRAALQCARIAHRPGLGAYQEAAGAPGGRVALHGEAHAALRGVHCDIGRRSRDGTQPQKHLYVAGAPAVLRLAVGHRSSRAPIAILQDG